MKKLQTCFLSLLLLAFCIHANAKDYIITDYGAKGDGQTNNTKFIQKAIDACAAKGGGRVIIPAGEFLSYLIAVKSNVDLHLLAGAKLSAVANGTKYVSLVSLENVENASVTGNGIIFGNGGNFAIKEEAPDRPYMILVKNSKNILIENVSLRQGAAWALRLFRSEHIKVKGISIYSHANLNNDGIDIDSKDVVISDCIIDCGDDAICLKSEDPGRITENITITNCVAASNCNLIKMGTGSLGGFKNISINNCVLRRATESPFHLWAEKPSHFMTEKITGISGIALEIVDGGVLDQVTITNISMTGVQTPIFMRLGSRKNPTGSFKNVIISNIVATSHSRMSCMIVGLPGFNIENVVLRDIFVNGPGGGTNEDAERKVPESEKEYPENRMFGWSVPASGLYVRHAKNITVDNFQLSLRTSDLRPTIFLDDVQLFKATNIKQDGAYIDGKLVRMVNSVKCTVNQ
jgi:polygalacturonase